MIFRCLVCRATYRLLRAPSTRQPMCCGTYTYPVSSPTADPIPDGGALDLLYANPEGVDQRCAWRVPWGRA